MEKRVLHICKFTCEQQTNRKNSLPIVCLVVTQWPPLLLLLLQFTTIKVKWRCISQFCKKIVEMCGI